MAIPSRKPITQIKTEEEMQKILEPYYGDRDKGQYFIGAAFGPGWNDIILDLHNKLVKENPEYFIAQIKEKFATLRYYTGPMTDAGWKYVEEAEELSAIACEECGRPGELREDGYWIVTLCEWDRNVRRLNIALARIRRLPYNLYWKVSNLYWKVRFAIKRWRRKNGWIQ